jgi:Mrp family chromosome partitioning ATPase
MVVSAWLGLWVSTLIFAACCTVHSRDPPHQGAKAVVDGLPALLLCSKPTHRQIMKTIVITSQKGGSGKTTSPPTWRSRSSAQAMGLRG